MRIIVLLLLSVVGVRANLLNSCTLNFPIKSVVTDASVTPSTNITTVTGGQNGLRIWTGEQPLTEPYCDVYVSKNGGAATKLRTFRYQGRIITGSPGDNFSLGTTDGRTFSVTPMWGPASVETVSGVTGTANCDKAGPPIWSPSRAHIILPANAHSFSVNSDGTERDVFLKEFDGNTWTPTRWFKLESNRATTVRTSYRQIALANYAGATLSVTAPLGSTIGGTSTTMSLTFPAITGTSRSVTNVTTFMSAVAAAVAGDEIVFADGTYALTNNLSHNSFVANEVAGNRGFEGITFRSASGIRTNVVISRSADTNGGWILDQRNNTGKTTYFKDLTFDETCSASTDATLYGLRWTDGSIQMQNVRVTGINLKDSDGEGVLYTFNNVNNSTVNLSYLFCQIDTQSGRLLNISGFQTNGPSGYGSLNPGTRQIIATDVFNGSSTAGLHNSIVVYQVVVGFYGGSIYDNAQYAADASYGATYHLLFTSFPQAGSTARSQNQINYCSMFGCNWTFYDGTLQLAGASDTNLMQSWVYCNTFSQIHQSGGNVVLSSACTNVAANNNRFILKTGQATQHFQGGGEFNWNIVTNGSYGVRNMSYAGVITNDFHAYGNDFDHFSSSYAIISTNNQFTTYLRNNACNVTDTSIETSAAGKLALNSDYNVFDPVVSANYTAGAHDTTGVNAQWDANYFPTASGNIDGNGDTSVVDYVGSTDPFGLVLIYKSTRISRGAREIPAIYSSAFLYPDLW